MQKTFEDICFEYQQKIIDVLNQEENIPFLVKYFLIKEIWMSVENQKMQLDMQVRQRHPSEEKQISTVVLNNNENIEVANEEENLTN